MIITRYTTAGMLLFCGAFFLMQSLPASAQDLPGKDYVIGAEDVLDIQVWGNDDLHRSVEVSQEGDFTFPLINNVRAAGLSVFELEKEMKKLLADGYLVDPHVSVTVSAYKSQKVFLLGEFKKTGTYVIKGKTHILKVIAEAGGLTDEASRIVTISRANTSPKRYRPAATDEEKNDLTIVLDLDEVQMGSVDERYIVFSGDSVSVSKAPPIYVTGEVNRPGEFTWKKRLTVRQAVSLAGGPTGKGALERTRITRTQNGQEKELKPDLNDSVQAYDIIRVPQSFF